MALPTSRNTTYRKDQQVLSADLNDLQDQIIGFKHPSITVYFGAGHYMGDEGDSSFWDGSGWNNLDFYWDSGAAGFSTHFGVAIPVGSRITAWSVKIQPVSASVVACCLYRSTGIGGTTVVGSIQSSSGSVLQTLSETVGAPYTTIADERYFILMDGTSNSVGFAAVHASLTFDRL